MFVPETNNMSEFMHNNSEFVTVLADGNGLRTLTSFTDK
jgi:hypothetical protein